MFKRFAQRISLTTLVFGLAACMVAAIHNLPDQMRQAYFVHADPGDAGAIPNYVYGSVSIVTAAAETRTLAAPTKPDLRLILRMTTDGGDCVVTVASAYDEAGATTLTFSDAGQFVELVSIETAVGTYAWRVASYEGVTGPTTALSSLTAGAITGNDSSLGITGQAAAQGGAILITGGDSATTGSAGGAVTIAGGLGGATGTGGGITLMTGLGQNITASGTGTPSGALLLTTTLGGTTVTGVGGASGTATLQVGAGGAASGAGTGGAGATLSLLGGAGGATTTGTGGAGSDIAITAAAGGAASGAGTGGAGGTIVLTPGTGGTTSGGTAGVDGVVIFRGMHIIKQGAPAAKTTSTTLTAAELCTTIITVNQAASGTSVLTLPLATALDSALPDAAAGDSFDFSVINTSTVDAEDASVVTNTGWTLVGNMDIHAYSAAGSLNSSARFRARKTGAGTWTLYRIS